VLRSAERVEGRAAARPIVYLPPQPPAELRRLDRQQPPQRHNRPLP
jgi:hypothetical protein